MNDLSKNKQTITDRKTISIWSRATWTWPAKFNHTPSNGSVHERVQWNIFNCLPFYIQSISTLYELDGIHHAHLHTFATGCQDAAKHCRQSNRTKLYAHVVKLDGNQFESFGFRQLCNHAVNVAESNIAVGYHAVCTTSMLALLRSVWPFGAHLNALVFLKVFIVRRAKLLEQPRDSVRNRCSFAFHVRDMGAKYTGVHQPRSERPNRLARRWLERELRPVGLAVPNEFRHRFHTIQCWYDAPSVFFLLHTKVDCSLLFVKL